MMQYNTSGYAQAVGLGLNSKVSNCEEGLPAITGVIGSVRNIWVLAYLLIASLEGSGFGMLEMLNLYTESRREYLTRRRS